MLPSKIKMRCSLIAIAISLVALSHQASAMAKRRFIYFGRQMPTQVDVAENWERMNRIETLDGMTFQLRIQNEDGTIPPGVLDWQNNLSSYVLSGDPRHDFSKGRFKASIDAAEESLKKAKWSDNKFNFLPVVPALSNFDWFSDSQWALIKSNWRRYLQLAKATGMVGLMMDNEAYSGRSVFGYEYLKRVFRNNSSFSEYVAKVRQRGRELGQIASEITPDLQLIFFMSYMKVLGSDLETAGYGLVPAFLDGLMEGSAENTRIFDGNEDYYTSGRDWGYFHTTRTRFYEKARLLSAVPDLFDKKARLSFSVWIDPQLSAGGAIQDVWDPVDFSKNYFSPERFGDILGYSARESDHFVWIYSHGPGFVPRKEFPDAYWNEFIEKKQKKYPKRKY